MVTPETPFYGSQETRRDWINQQTNRGLQVFYMNDAVLAEQSTVRTTGAATYGLTGCVALAVQFKNQGVVAHYHPLTVAVDGHIPTLVSALRTGLERSKPLGAYVLDLGFETDANSPTGIKPHAHVAERAANISQDIRDILGSKLPVIHAGYEDGVIGADVNQPERGSVVLEYPAGKPAALRVGGRPVRLF